MAVDTRDKRASCLGLVYPSRAALPYRDGAISQADRQHLTWVYRGITAAAPIGIARLAVTLSEVSRLDVTLSQTPRLDVTLSEVSRLDVTLTLPS